MKNLDTFLAEETRRVEAFLKGAPGTRYPISAAHLKLAPAAFVRRSFELHENLVRAWGGWYCHGESEAVARGVDETRAVLRQEWDGFLKRWYAAYQSGVLDSNCDILADGDYVLPYIEKKTFEEGLQRFRLGHRAKVYNAKEREECLRVNQFPMDRVSPVTVQGAVRSGSRVAASILKILDASEVSPAYRKLWEGFLSACGEKVWVEAQSKLAATLSCAPSSFLRLGHYGEKSCYANGKERQASKLWLAADMPDSFVLLVFRPKVAGGAGTISKRSGRRQGVRVAARAWGIGEIGHGVLLSNFYLLDYQNIKSVVLSAVRKGMALPDAPEKMLVCGSQQETELRVLIADAVYINTQRGKADNAPWFGKPEAYQNMLKRIGYARLFGLYARNGEGPDRNYLAYITDSSPPSPWLYAAVKYVEMAKEVCGLQPEPLVRRRSTAPTANPPELTWNMPVDQVFEQQFRAQVAAEQRANAAAQQAGF